MTREGLDALLAEAWEEMQAEVSSDQLISPSTDLTPLPMEPAVEAGAEVYSEEVYIPISRLEELLRIERDHKRCKARLERIVVAYVALGASLV